MVARSYGPAERGVSRVHQLARPGAQPQAPVKHSLRPRLVAFAPSVAEAVDVAGGWLFDQVMEGWDVTVVTEDQVDERPLRILGVHGRDLESALNFHVQGSCVQAIAVRAELYRADERVRQLVRAAAETDRADIRVWGDAWPDDLAAANFKTDVIQQLENVAERYRRSPELIGMFTVLLTENLNPDAPLHARFLTRYQSSVNIVAAHIRRGQRTGRYRTDLNPAVKAAEIVAFLTGMETSWLLDPSVPLNEVFHEYTSSLALQLSPKPLSSAP